MKPVRALYFEVYATKKKISYTYTPVWPKKMCFFNLFCAKIAQTSSLFV